MEETQMAMSIQTHLVGRNNDWMKNILVNIAIMTLLTPRGIHTIAWKTYDISFI